MNLRLVHFNLAPESRDAAKSITDRVIPLIRAQPGCVRGEFFGDNAAGEYGIVVLWDSRQAADAAAAVVSPVLSNALSGLNVSGESRQLYEVYEPGT